MPNNSDYGQLPSFKGLIENVLDSHFSDIKSKNEAAINFLIGKTLDEIPAGSLPAGFNLQEIINKVTEQVYASQDPDPAQSALRDMLKSPKDLLALATATRQASNDFNEQHQAMQSNLPTVTPDDEYARAIVGDYAPLSGVVRPGDLVMPDTLKQRVPFVKDQAHYASIDPVYKKKESCFINDIRDLEKSLMNNFKFEVPSPVTDEKPFKFNKNEHAEIFKQVVQMAVRNFDAMDKDTVTTPLLQDCVRNALKNTLGGYFPDIKTSTPAQLNAIVPKSLMTDVINAVYEQNVELAGSRQVTAGALEEGMRGAPDAGAGKPLPLDQNYGTMPTSPPDQTPATFEHNSDKGEYTEFKIPKSEPDPDEPQMSGPALN